MVFCSKCGRENEDNATFCQNCGTRIKPENNKTEISKLFNLKAIIFGGIAWAVSVVVFLLIATSLNASNSIAVILLIFGQLISGIVAGYISGREFSAGILNAIIIAIFYSIIYWLSSGYSFIDALVILTVFAIIGGILGVLVYRRTKV